MTIEMQQKWDKFLIDAWFVNKGARMCNIKNQFVDINPMEEEEYKKLLRVPLYGHEYKNDVFSFIAIGYSVISNLLLSTKKSDTERIDKILIKFSKMKKLISVKDKRYLSEAKNATKYAEKLEKVTWDSRVLISESRLKAGGHDWKTVK
jgi:hypothetical protein